MPPENMTSVVWRRRTRRRLPSGAREIRDEFELEVGSLLERVVLDSSRTISPDVRAASRTWGAPGRRPAPATRSWWLRAAVLPLRWPARDADRAGEPVLWRAASRRSGQGRGRRARRRPLQGHGEPGDHQASAPPRRCGSSASRSAGRAGRPTSAAARHRRKEPSASSAASGRCGRTCWARSPSGGRVSLLEHQPAAAGPPGERPSAPVWASAR